MFHSWVISAAFWLPARPNSLEQHGRVLDRPSNRFVPCLACSGGTFLGLYVIRMSASWPPVRYIGLS
jgi:hypothetical protein